MTTLSKLDEYIPALRLYAWAMLRNSGEADDLARDCLLRAVERIHAVRTDDELRRWLFTIMHNLCVNRWRRRPVRARVIAEDSRADHAVAASQPATAEMRAVLRSLAELPGDQRSVLVLVAVERFQYDEVAKMLDIPMGTVRSRLSHARDRSREVVEGMERPMLRRVK
jgi:RNA polymerase sigma-70 factor, ECF subfamily